MQILNAAQATDEDGTKYLKGKAQLIEGLEATLPSWVRRPHWYPPFVHMLKVRSMHPQPCQC